uniref:Uncharacterized protein n=1 Tax=Leersia perrieri TaxID=77586 RepID=A0A0D9XB94_9ORYZ
MEKGTKMMGKQQTLLQAAFDGNLRLLRKMARGLDTTGQGEAAVLAAVAGGTNGTRALHMAASGGSMDFSSTSSRISALTSTNSLIKVKHQCTFLQFTGELLLQDIFLIMVLILQWDCEIVELLLSRGVDVDLDSTGGTPLQAAAISGQHSTMKILLEHHAAPNRVFNLDGTALNMSIFSGSLECVKLLIKVGADVNFRDSNGVICVMIAANHATSDITKCLLDAGANPNIPDEFYTTPIEAAAHRGRRDIVELLFPLTKPISTLPNWSVDGIISHVKTFGLKPRDKDLSKRKRAELKLQAREAFERKEYMLAGQHYTNAMQLNPSDGENAILLANRSLCFLRMTCRNGALADANMCRMLRPHWPKACYRQGAAFMLLKLDPTNEDMEKALRDAFEAMKKDRLEQRPLTP